MQCKKYKYFPFNFGLNSIQLYVFHEEQGWGVYIYLQETKPVNSDKSHMLIDTFDMEMPGIVPLINLSLHF